MTKYVLDDYDGPELDYSTLGFRASPGDILDATGAPDARWSVNGDQGAAETVDRYTLGGDADYVEPTDGHVLTYSDAENAYVPTAPTTFLVDNVDGPTATNIANPASLTAGALAASIETALEPVRTLAQRVEKAAPSLARPWLAPNLLRTWRALLVDPADPTGQTIWYVADSSLARSTDGGATKTNMALPTQLAGISGYNSLALVRFEGALIYVVSTASGTGQILRSTAATPGSGDWTTVHTLSVNAGGFPYCIDYDDTYVYVCEYTGAFLTACEVLRSADGITWEVIDTLGAGNHYHAIKADPWNPGHLYLSVGDTTDYTLRFSDDYGDTWTNVANMGSTRLADNIGITEDWIYLAADNSGSDLIVLDKATLTPRNGTIGNHQLIAVPNPGVYDNGATTNGSTTFTCGAPDYSGKFSANDVGRKIMGSGIPAGTTIAGFTSASSVTLSAAATATATQVVYTVDRPERFGTMCRLGDVDPETGVYYFLGGHEDTNPPAGGRWPRLGLFCVPYIGGPVVLLRVLEDACSLLKVQGSKVIFGGYVMRALR